MTNPDKNRKVTLVLDEKNYVKLKKIQAKKIKKTKHGWSFSTIVKLVLIQGIKNQRKKKSKKTHL